MSLNQIESARILLVDDNPTNLKVLSAAITSAGWTALVATDGESAIEQTEYAKPDLILLDVMMPGIDGFETCKRLKTKGDTAAIPIIFMTALSDTVDKVRGLELGAVDYVTKPFQQEEVLARVRLHLKVYYLTQQLEEAVKERTAELTDSIHQLEQTQLQLIQNEKMSTLGQLVAGVAHEINNPVGFINGNLSCIKDYTADLLEHLQMYQEQYPETVEEIEDHAEDIDLEFLLEDLPKMLGSMEVGIERIRNISTSLRTFSRSDSQSKVSFNLHEGLDSTLLILRHRLKANETRPAVEITKEYGELSTVKCYPGQLNQVFMNVLANAIDAMDEANQDKSFEDLEASPNTVLIKTELDHKHHGVIIRIRDNGPGMAPEVRAKIFDHLFTTKTVGKGTGLGLSISRQIIVENHGGTIACESFLGQGTEFVISIPV
jgi:signal transduction histidine kinase